MIEGLPIAMVVAAAASSGIILALSVERWRARPRPVVAPLGGEHALEMEQLRKLSLEKNRLDEIREQMIGRYIGQEVPANVRDEWFGATMRYPHAVTVNKLATVTNNQGFGVSLNPMAKAVLEWAEENTTGGHDLRMAFNYSAASATHVIKARMAFEHEEDAALFKLKWS